ncbi:MAG: hypothetical protein NC225_12350 [Clostridium sp.]|nr:hypothetical protein [Clostridium sp.]MCM1400260.1 hypothetical protein [Clostridium sp.]MCM1460973.1 hypothetical protein [Bacteroides sp.]
MTDNIKTINIINHPLQVPKFHGHMKLELSGSREKLVVEHDNNMTEALEKLFDNKGIWCNPYTLIDDMCPTVEKALGGILLTDKAIPDGNLYVPAGTEVTGCASYNVANADEALTMGSYNQQESALDIASKKMTYVYDWTTNQANGTIAAACLTHANAGYASYGDANISDINMYSGNPNILYSGIQISTPVKSVYSNDEYMYTAVLNNGMIIIKKLRNCFKSVEPISVMFGQPNYMDYKTMQTWEFQCDGLNNIDIMCSDGNSVYFGKAENIPPGGALQIHKFNFTDTDVTHDVLNISNTSTHILNAQYGMVVANGYLYVKTNTDIYLIEINMDNNSDTNEYSIDTSIYLNGTWNINGKLFMTTASTAAGACVLDTVTKTMKFTKCSMGRGNNLFTGDIWNKISVVGNSSMLFKILNYLATINNLDKPVTKTADKTMKITYTIQG